METMEERDQASSEAEQTEGGSDVPGEADVVMLRIHADRLRDLVWLLERAIYSMPNTYPDGLDYFRIKVQEYAAEFRKLYTDLTGKEFKEWLPDTPAKRAMTGAGDEPR
jgi:hypothetical protein